MMNMIPDESLPKGQKLLIVIYKLSNGTTKSLKFEDIVVKAFKQYPETFHLRGYKQYPDSGDLVHKPLYDMRSKGLLIASNKTFALTSKGLQTAEKISSLISKGGKSNYKPARDIKNELERIMTSEAFGLYLKEDTNKILDTDFLEYLGVGAHTSKNEFKNRMSNIEYIIAESKNFLSSKEFSKIQKYHEVLISKFQPIIQSFIHKKERSV